MLVFGFGISMDVDNLSFAVLDRDQTPESRAYIQEFTGSRYFTEKRPITDYADLEHRLQDGDIKAAIEIPPGFGRDIKHGRPVWVAAWIDGAMPFRAETMRGYIAGHAPAYLVSNLEDDGQGRLAAPAKVERRFKYNQDFDSIFAMVPSRSPAACIVTRDPDGAWRLSERKSSARSPTFMSRQSRASNFCLANRSPTSPSPWSILASCS